MSLENKIQDLITRKLVKKETIRNDQIEKALKRAKKDLKVAQANLAIDEEAAYNYAYLAMLRTGRALMFTYGYRPIDGFQHWTVGEFARRMLGQEAQKSAEQFDQMRRTRNDFTYEPDIPVSKMEAYDAITYAHNFIGCVSKEIAAVNPEIKID